MRTEPAPEDLEADAGIEQVDHRSAPHEVLEAIDDQLAPHGLEVVMLDTGDDSYAWKLAARGAPAT